MRVMSLAFSPDGRTLASAGEGGGLKLWNVATRQVALTLKGHMGWVCRDRLLAGWQPHGKLRRRCHRAALARRDG